MENNTMFVKRGDGKITSIIEEKDLDKKAKKVVKEKLEQEDQKSEKQ